MGYDYGVKEISKHTGLTGVESKNIAMALKKKGIDYTAVDWKTLGEDTRDFGNRSGAVWNKLGRMSGISRPQTHMAMRIQEAKPDYIEGVQLDMLLARHLNRSPRSIALDDHIRARHVFSQTNKRGIQLWMKRPNQYDVRGIDYTKFRKRRR